jgi:tRNA-splicing endonuclease subunit Sen2
MEPTVHIGVWDPDTRSVHIRDARSIRAMWEQGFFGKGSLSRSEPNWLKRELSRRAGKAGTVSEVRTEARREERRNAKWERAKAELEALEQQRLEEARLEEARLEEARLVEARLAELQAAEAKARVVPQPTPGEATPPRTPPLGAKPPVGPAELLALPNSMASLTMKHIPVSVERTFKPPVGPAELLALPNSSATSGLLAVVSEASASTTLVNEHLDEVKAAVTNGVANGIVSPPASVASASGSAESASTESKDERPMKRRKSVRFSPQVESTTFQHHDPPSPRHSAGGSPPRTMSALVGGTPVADVVVAPSPSTITLEEAAPVLETTIAAGELANKEHFQLAPEEAFFLVFALGALSVVDPVTLAPIPTDKLLDLFRSYSYYPPLETSSPSVSLQPQDPFLVNYAVYHHFRSLGWVPRHGIKFGVDYILYQRGPVFDHSEFAVMVLPSFSDKRWEKIEHESPKKSWSWLMGVNRVLSHVLKSMVLVYVDIPPPPVFEGAMRQGGIAEALKNYTMREVMVRRFSVNRNRD